MDLGGGGGMMGAASGGDQVNQGPELELIMTEGLGFLALKGDAKVQLTPKWNDPPAPTATLLTIASRKGLVAAAGPESISIATTENVRKTFEANKEGGSEVRPFQPQFTLPMPIRVSQISFTADEEYLLLSAETGGGIAVYNVNSLAQGSTKPEFELPTENETLRALVPNPMADKAELVALVTNNGNLLMANLKERNFVSGPNGPVLRPQVSCAAWSSKGKQLVAGSADGTIYQMTPDGQVKAHIPKPPGLSDFHIASVVWLENDVFLTVHNPTNGTEQSVFNIITRSGPRVVPATFEYRRLKNPVEPYSDKTPHHAILRLRDFPPELQDLLLVASTALENVGVLSRSKKPLATDVDADKIVNVFTTTEFTEDTNRAQVPMSSDGFSDTFPIGAALDLSCKDKVEQPIPGDEITESPGPLPGLWVINNEGVLSSWWVIYHDSIRQGTTFSGLLPSDSASAPMQNTPAPQATQSAFGSAAAPAAAPAFGGASALGQKSSPWSTAAASATPTAAPAFGSSSFGSAPAAAAPAFGTSALGGMGAKPSPPAFGQSTTMGLGMRTSPWGAAGGAKSAFGQPSFGSPSAPAASPFASAAQSTSSPFASSTPSGGGFSSFASKGGFTSLASGGDNKGGFAGLGSGAEGGNPFGSGKAFGATAPTPADAPSAFGTPATKPAESVFGNTASKPAAGAFGSTPFVLGTTFKSDSASANDNEMSPEEAKSRVAFSSGFGLSLGDKSASVPPEVKEEDMEADASNSKASDESTTPKNTPAPSKFFGAPSGLGSGSLFGFTKTKEPVAEAPRPEGNNQEAPLPPDTMSKATYPLGESSSSSGSSAFSPDRIIETNDTPTDAPATKISTIRVAPKAVEPDDVPLPPMPSMKERTRLSNLPALPTEEPDDAPLPPMPSAKERVKLANQPALPTTAASDDAPLPPMPSMKERTKLANQPALPTTAASDDAPLPPMPSMKERTKLANQPALPTGKPQPTPGLPSDGPAKPNPFAKPIFSAPKATAPAKISPFSVMNQARPGDVSNTKNPFANLAPLPSAPSSDDESGGSEDGEHEEESEEAEDREEGEVSEEEEDDEGYEEPDDESAEADDADAVSLPPSEGSGTDVAKDFTRENTTAALGQTPGYTPESSFAGMADSTFSTTLRPAESTGLFGEIGQPPQQFYPPTRTSPRSPSPVRKPLPSAVPARVFRSDSQRSVSAPGMASQILGGPKKPAVPAYSVTSRPPPVQDVNVEEQRRNQAKKQEEEARQLVDDEYDFIERQLDEPIEPTLQMAECVFKVGNDVQGASTIAAQCEAVYRDINRMIQACKINARNLKSFIAGHSGEGRPGEDTPREKEDLEDADKWLLCDIHTCDVVLTGDLGAELTEARVPNVEEFTKSVEAVEKELTKVRALHKDVKKMVEARRNPDQLAAAKSTPLSAEQVAQQNDLRRGFTQLCKDLAEAEQALVLLKTKIVSAGGTTGRAGPPPTVEAVMRTITKMTTMAEKRSGDVDMLEAQMRRMGWSPDPEREREASPAELTTPVKRGSVYAPGSAIKSLASSMASMGIRGSPARGTPPRKKMTHFTDKEKAEVRAKKAGRQRTMQELRKALAENGPVVVSYEEK